MNNILLENDQCIFYFYSMYKSKPNENPDPYTVKFFDFLGHQVDTRYFKTFEERDLFYASVRAAIENKIQRLDWDSLIINLPEIYESVKYLKNIVDK